jgi:kynurenine formamidase
MKFVDISYGIFTPHLTAFALGVPERKSLYSLQDGSCMCEGIEFVPHAHCTHTETVHHIQERHEFASLDVIRDIPLLQDCLVLDYHSLSSGEIEKDESVGAVIVKFGLSLPFPDSPPHFRKDDMRALINSFPNASHLLCDLPSLDGKDDAMLTCHHIFFAAHPRGTVTEMCNLKHVDAGMYKLCLAPLIINGSDAHPSRPLLCCQEGR